MGLKTPARIARLPHDPRGLPILATIQRDANWHARFSQLSNQRKLALAIFDWCGVCGLPFDGEERFTVVPADVSGPVEDAFWSSEAPVHEVCAYYAAQVCPYLLDPQAVIRRGPARGAGRGAIRIAGFRDVVGVREDHLGGVVIGLEGLGAVHVLDEAVSSRYDALLAEDAPPLANRALMQLVDTFEQADPIHEVVCGAVLASAFAPQVNVPSLQHIRSSLRDPHPVALNPAAMPAVCAVREWLASCATLPPLIAASEICKSLRTPASGAQVRAIKDGRNHPCPCGSGMKFKRCHGR